MFSLENYQLIHKKVYLNKKLKSLLANHSKNYVNIYFLINSYGYIPNMDYSNLQKVINFIKKKTRKKTIYSHPLKAVFCDQKINFNSDTATHLILKLSNSCRINYKELIFFPFGKQLREFFTSCDILTWDILISVVNLKDREKIPLREIYRFSKQTGNSPTSTKQLIPYKKRLNYISQIFDLKVEKNNVIVNRKEISQLLKNMPYFYVPSEIYSLDTKNKFSKRILYYLFYIGQIKHFKRDKKPVTMLSLLKNSGTRYEQIRKQKGFPFIEEKIFSCFQKAEKFFKIKTEGNYRNFYQFLDTQIYIKPTQYYRKILKCIR
ncbi:MAG: hypothetical protein Q9M89_10645 [Persephonella sp.]|nr:hypothetical protein [Persephonella sp.]